MDAVSAATTDAVSVIIFLKKAGNLYFRLQSSMKEQLQLRPAFIRLFRRFRNHFTDIGVVHFYLQQI